MNQAAVARWARGKDANVMEGTPAVLHYSDGCGGYENSPCISCLEEKRKDHPDEGGIIEDNVVIGHYHSRVGSKYLIVALADDGSGTMWRWRAPI